MDSNLLETDINDILHTVITDAGEDLLLIDPTEESIQAVVDVATAFDGELPTIRMLAEERPVKQTMEDFLVASRAADLIDGGKLSIRLLDDPAANSLLVSGDSVFALVAAGDRIAALSTDDGSFVESARESYDDQWAAAEEYHLRTPPISRVRETLGADIGEAVQEDFDAVLADLDTARGDGEGLDEVTISLLVAARNEVLLYDISKWGEDVGIASKATFSRTKTRLEDMGLIDTEKVPIDVGRPRLRLQLGDNRLREADAEELAAVSQELLA
ncbi:MAG: transcriptional regulator TbsP [Natrialbaceae archaeon]